MSPALMPTLMTPPEVVTVLLLPMTNAPALPPGWPLMMNPEPISIYEMADRLVPDAKDQVPVSVK